MLFNRKSRDWHEFRKDVQGIGEKVLLANNQKGVYINLDNAASTPALRPVVQEMEDFLNWYSGVHRGMGYKSLLSSQLYEEAHTIVGRFLNADPDQNTVIFLKNTTEAINKLSYRFNFVPGDMVLTTEMEHHSNDLPWRGRARVKYAAVDERGVLDVNDVEKQLKLNYPRVKLLAVTGASNVTGHINDVHYLAGLAHEHKAMIMVDGAQLAPHMQLDLKAAHHPQHIDFVAFSGHKIYAPYGTGVLVGPREFFLKGDPEYVGGGTVDMVTGAQVYWTRLPDREEAGSPNVVGAVALARTLQYLGKLGMENLAAYESVLCAHGLKQLKTVPGITVYGATPRVGVISFNLAGFNPTQLGTILCHEGGIAVRTGCFCAQPYIRKLLGERDNVKLLPFYKNKDPDNLPGMVRISLGAYNTEGEIDAVVNLLKKIASDRRYYQVNYRYSPDTRSYLPAAAQKKMWQEIQAHCRTFLEI
ncbi:MAG TPA: aminotransferase class V-fold PLP-dependent enzyme [Syntrophomonas sp.]|nr:aminotransferase class V-fold PLP-dependent enzyme [Syntrophomonas sp.]